MIPAPFAYARPSTVDEALQAVASGGEDVKVLAGGQSLIPVMRLRLAAPETVVDLTRVAELRGVREEGDTLVIGAMTTHSDVVSDPLVARHARLLAQATETVADRQVRHRGTLGGALAHADPAGDLPAVALALDAEFVIAGLSGRRTVPAAEFFVDYLTTALEEGELLVEIRLPKREGWGTHYEKFNRVAQAWSIVAVAAAVRMEGGRIAEVRVGLTNMGPTPIRAAGVEAALTGADATAEAIGSAAGTVRRPPGPAMTNSASSASATAGRSPAGSACARAPPKVPRCRTWRSATVSVASAMSGAYRAISGSDRTSECVVIAPMTIASLSSRTPRSSATFVRSTTVSGAASRSRMTGISDCPPAMTLTSSPPSAMACNASSTVVGRA